MPISPFAVLRANLQVAKVTEGRDAAPGYLVFGQKYDNEITAVYYGLR